MNDFYVCPVDNCCSARRNQLFVPDPLVLTTGINQCCNFLQTCRTFLLMHETDFFMAVVVLNPRVIHSS